MGRAGVAAGVGAVVMLGGVLGVAGLALADGAGGRPAAPARSSARTSPLAAPPAVSPCPTAPAPRAPAALGADPGAGAAGSGGDPTPAGAAER